MSDWISIAEKMPDLYQIVALAHNDRWMNTVRHEEQGLNWYGAGYLDDGHSHGPYWNIIGESRAQCLDAVTHWMPLPVVPQ